MKRQKVNIIGTDVYFVVGIVIPTRRRGKTKDTCISADWWEIILPSTTHKKESTPKCIILPVMLFIFNLYTFIFSPLYMFEVKTGKKKNVIRRHEQTNWKDDKKFNGFLYFVCCSYFLYRLCSYSRRLIFPAFFCLFASFAWCKNFLINVLNFTRKKEQREESNLTYINDVLEQNHISRVFCYRSSIVNCRSGVKV